MYNQVKLFLLLAITTGANFINANGYDFLRNKEAAAYLSKVHGEATSTTRECLEKFTQCSEKSLRWAHWEDNPIDDCLSQLKTAMDKMFESKTAILEIERNNINKPFNVIAHLALKAEEAKAEAARLETLLAEATQAVSAQEEAKK